MQVTTAGSTNSVFYDTDITIDPLADLSILRQVIPDDGSV